MSKHPESTPEPTRVLFVCLGNICRSPVAEFVVRNRATECGIDGQFIFDSAGTGDWHIGNPADTRMLRTALNRGVDMHAHRAMQVTEGNIGKWDWLIAMDENNRLDLLDMGADENKLLMMRQFEADNPNAPVPDPYYGGEQGFEEVFDIMLRNADPILDKLSKPLG
ncbi:MAG: low molecular weight protein-tyrosine-phosphatase [Mariprofundaceae bacterium]